MREIKFRVWNKTDEEMCYLLENGWSFGPSEEVRAFSWEDVFAAREQDLIPLQYTGLKDKNGVKIYEGDIVREKFDDGHYVGKVVFKDAAFWVEFKPDEELLLGCDSEETEVIGNIYENPELLEVIK